MGGTPETDLHGIDRMAQLRERELAKRWAISQRTLQRWRTEGYGPPYLNIGGSIRYRMGDILDYERRHRHGGEDCA